MIALNYPLTKGVAFMTKTGFWLRGHVVIVGSLGFAVFWREPAHPLDEDGLPRAQPTRLYR